MMCTFANYEFDEYNAEAQEKWGASQAYKEHAEKTKDYSRQKWDDLAAGTDQIMADFAVCMKNGNAPDSAASQSLVKALQDHISENYYSCTNQILASLGQMYVLDERFRNNIDQHGTGTAQFICHSITAYCRSR